MGPGFEVSAADFSEVDITATKDTNLHPTTSNSIGQLNYLFVSYLAAEILILEIKHRNSSTQGGFGSILLPEVRVTNRSPISSWHTTAIETLS